MGLLLHQNPFASPMLARRELFVQGALQDAIDDLEGYIGSDKEWIERIHHVG